MAHDGRRCSSQASCGTPTSEGQKRVQCSRHRCTASPMPPFPAQEASKRYQPPYFHIAPLLLIIACQTKHIDLRGCFSPLPLEDNDNWCGFCWFPWQRQTQIPKLSWAQPTFSDRPRGSLFVSAVCRQTWEQLGPGSRRSVEAGRIGFGIFEVSTQSFLPPSPTPRLMRVSSLSRRDQWSASRSNVSSLKTSSRPVSR